jgi:CO/xanthine dehydrogenase Mo-binding subunit
VLSELTATNSRIQHSINRVAVQLETDAQQARNEARKRKQAAAAKPPTTPLQQVSAEDLALERAVYQLACGHPERGWRAIQLKLEKQGRSLGVAHEQ